MCIFPYSICSSHFANSIWPNQKKWKHCRTTLPCCRFSLLLLLLLLFLSFGFVSLWCFWLPGRTKPAQTMTIIIKSEKSKRLLSLKIAHQNGINIVEGGERGAATTLHGVNAGLPSINLSAKFFISPPKNTRNNSTWNMECFSSQGGERKIEGSWVGLRIVWVAVKKAARKIWRQMLTPPVRQPVCPRVRFGHFNRHHVRNF